MSFVTGRSKKRKEAMNIPPLPPRPKKTETPPITPPPTATRKRAIARLEETEKVLKRGGFNTPKKQKAEKFGQGKDLNVSAESDIHLKGAFDQMIHIDKFTTPTKLANAIEEAAKKGKSSTIVLGKRYQAGGGHANALEYIPAKPPKSSKSKAARPAKIKIHESENSDVAHMIPHVQQSTQKLKEEKGMNITIEQVKHHCNASGDGCQDIAMSLHNLNTPKRAKALAKLDTQREMMKHFKASQKLIDSPSTTPTSRNIARQIKHNASIPTFATMMRAQKAINRYKEKQ